MNLANFSWVERDGSWDSNPVSLFTNPTPNHCTNYPPEREVTENWPKIRSYFPRYQWWPWLQFTWLICCIYIWVCTARVSVTIYQSYCRMLQTSTSLQSCPTLCNPIDGSPPGSPVPGILQARILEWVAISFSNAWKWKVKVRLLSCIRLLATPWTAAYQAPPSTGYSRQEYWSGVQENTRLLSSDFHRWNK